MRNPFKVRFEMRNPLKDKRGLIGKKEEEEEAIVIKVKWIDSIWKKWKIDEDKNNFNRYNKKGHGNEENNGEKKIHAYIYQIYMLKVL